VQPVSGQDPREHRALPRWLMRLLQWTVSLGLLAALVAMVDWGELRDALAALSTERYWRSSCCASVRRQCSCCAGVR
jgi:hypothetical protein